MAGDSLAEAKSLHLPSRFGDLPDRWSWLRLDDACEGVFDCPHSTPKLVSSGPFVVRSQDIITGVFRTDQAARVSEETYRERTSRVVPARGDILYSREGTYFGIAAEVPEDTRVCLGQRMVLIRPRNGVIDFRFLRHWLNSPIMASRIHGYRDGSVAERLNLPTIRALPVVVPPLREQRAIAHILGTLDDKIELNRRMSKTLEAMARALFKSWFVDFDPVRLRQGCGGQVRAKAEGRDSGVPKPLADLFPDSFEDSELGEIPKGWRVGTLEAYSVLNPESWSKETAPDEVEYVDLANTKWGKIEATQRHAWADAPSRAQRILRPGDTIVGTVRPGNGSYAFISEDRLTGSTGFAVLRPRKPDFREFVYLAATVAENIEALAHLADGAAYPAVRPEVVVSTPTVCPTDAVVAHFASATSVFLAKTAQTDKESRTLAALRDTLLPKLISGELRVKDAERIVEIV